MSETLELHEPKVTEMDTMINEYVENVKQALEIESNKIKEQAEKESNQIVASAKEEGEKILKEYREKASKEARQESARIINETKEKTAQVIKEFIEQGVTQAKDEFNRTISEVQVRLESEKTKLLNISESIEQLIEETKTSIQTGIEHLSTLTNETEKKLRTVNDLSQSGNFMNHQQSTEEARIEPTDNLEKKETEQVNERTTEPEIEKSSPLNHADDKLEHNQAEDYVVNKLEKTPKNETSNNINACIQEGIFLLDSGKNKEALEAFVKALELDPKNAFAWRKKGAALGKMYRNMDALKAFEKAIELDPKDITSWHNKVLALNNMGRRKEAMEAQMIEKGLKKEAK